MDEQVVQQIVDEVFSSLEPLDTQSAAVLQFLKAKGIASDEELAPYLEQAGNVSSVRWLAARVRIKSLISSAMKNVDTKPAESKPAEATSERTKDEETNSTENKSTEMKPAEQKAEKANSKDSGENSDDTQKKQPTNSDKRNSGEPPQAAKDDENTRAERSAPSSEKDRNKANQGDGVTKEKVA